MLEQSSGGPQLPQTCLPRAALGPVALRGLCKGFVKGDPKGWAVLRAAKADSFLPWALDAMGSQCPGQNKAVLSQA